MAQKTLFFENMFGGIAVKIAFGLALLFILLAIIAFKPAGMGDVYVTSQPERNAISVSGESVLYSEPDKATLIFGYEAEAATAEASQQNNAAVIEEIRRALADSGIARDELKTAYYNVEPVRRWDEKDRSYSIIGYKTTHLLKIETETIGENSMKNIGEYIDIAVAAGANRIDSISFGLTDEKRDILQKQALEIASKDAKEKAQKIALGLGVKATNLVSASEGAIYRAYTQTYAYDMAEARVSGAPTEITPGQVSISATVSASFEFK